MTDPLVRLHITPLTPDLLPAILGRQLIQVAQNVSFHSIQTAPDSSYGYVELPQMDADKIKKKLNGATLKGKKVNIAEARPLKRRHTETEDGATTEPVAPLTKSKKPKKTPHTLVAHELSPDRKVKRGWTEPKTEKTKKSKKDKTTKPQAPSKYTEKSELLFRTSIPANKKPIDGKERRRKTPGNADVVHEFEKTTVVPSFLRNSASSSTKLASEYKDGEGWVDSEGHIVEEETMAASRRRKVAKEGLGVDVRRAQATNTSSEQRTTSSPPNDSSSDISSTEMSSSDTDSVNFHGIEKLASGVEQSAPADETSSSGTSSDSESGSESESEPNSEPVSTPDEDAEEAKPEPQQLTNGNSTESKPASESSHEVHPLEALFKKPKPTIQTQASSVVSPPLSTPKPPRLELHTSFSFFQNPDDIEQEGEEENRNKNKAGRGPSSAISRIGGRRPSIDDQSISTDFPPMPLTPFSTQDFHRRRLRSAAPTPDTADIRKSTGYGSLILGEDDPDDVLSEYGDEDTNITATTHSHLNGTTHKFQHHLHNQTTDPHIPSSAAGEPSDPTDKPAISDFEKKFWDKRGENNRAWKARRRAVLKEKRQRENRRSRPVGF